MLKRVFERKYLKESVFLKLLHVTIEVRFDIISIEWGKVNGAERLK